MMSFEITISTEKEIQLIDEKIVDFNKNYEPFTQPKDFIDLDFHIKNESGMVVAGINSLMYCWGILYIDTLFVADNYRNQGFGTRLLNKVEEQAKLMGASLSHLDTFDWQAKDFYLKAGYEVFGTLEGCPPGHKRYYLKKVLNQCVSGSRVRSY